jgi:hypothetical protein
MQMIGLETYQARHMVPKKKYFWNQILYTPTHYLIFFFFFFFVATRAYMKLQDISL